MSKIREPFDPFAGLSKRAKVYDPLAGIKLDPADLVGQLQTRIAQLEIISDVETADRIIAELKFYRERVETLLDLAVKEIAVLQAERDAPIDEIEHAMLITALDALQAARAERDAALDELALHKRGFSEFARLSYARYHDLVTEYDDTSKSTSVAPAPDDSHESER